MGFSIAKYRQAAASKSRQLAEVRGSSHMTAAGNGGLMLISAAAAGALDAKAGEIAGASPSIIVAAVTATAGMFAKSPKLIYAASGMLAPHAYMASKEWVEGMDDKE